MVTIFGGARFLMDDFYSKEAYRLGNRFAQSGISVLTGGGAGIMEAASSGFGVPEPGKNNAIIGISVVGLDEEGRRYLGERIRLQYFFARKYLLTNYSRAFVVFPGGFGTLNELSEVLMLIQTHTLRRVPVILIGTEYWKQFMDWLSQEIVSHGAITSQDLLLFCVTDDLDFAFEQVCKTCGSADNV